MKVIDDFVRDVVSDRNWPPYPSSNDLVRVVLYGRDYYVYLDVTNLFLSSISDNSMNCMDIYNMIYFIRLHCSYYRNVFVILCFILLYTFFFTLVHSKSI